MPIVKEVKPLSVASKQVATRFGQKTRFYLFCEGEEVPYGTWNQSFALALKEQIGKVVQIAYEEQGQYKNLVVPERFKGGNRMNILVEKVTEIEKKIDKILKKFEIE